MKRETKLNLIFLTVFLAVSLPGAVILFIRKLDPNAAPMYLPDPVRHRLPYMAPQWTPDEEVTRVIPPQTGEWLEEINRQQGNTEPILMRDRLPVISTDRLIQVAGTKTIDSKFIVHLIAWDSYGVDAGQYDASLRIAGAVEKGAVKSARNIAMPDPVRKELMNGGYVKPRHWITWIELEFPAPPANQQALVLQISYKEGNAAVSSSVNLFTQ
jgi:hypothetical protein